MRYPEQLKHSWGYHWGLFREIWDILTLGKVKWYLVLILGAFFFLPFIIEIVNSSTVSLFLALPRIVPPPDVGADILSARDFVMKGTPPFILTLNYYWVQGGWFLLVGKVVSIIMLVAFAGAWLRGAGGIDKEIYNSPR